MINDTRVADPRHAPLLTPPHEVLTRLLPQLERYAGWLAKDHVSVAVRADVQALAAAMQRGHETSVLLLTLEKDLVRLPSGDVRKMLRKTLREIRTVLGPGGIADDDREGS